MVNQPLFKELYDIWIEYKINLNNGISNSTKRNYNLAFGWCSDLHNMKFNCIRVDDIQTVVDKYKGKSESTVTTIKTILYQMYGYALKREIVEKNYAALVDYEWTNNKEKLHINFTSDEINILWGHQDTQHVDLVLMLIYTGFRVSEFLSLENKNVHLKERYIVGGMKTKAGI